MRSLVLAIVSLLWLCTQSVHSQEVMRIGFYNLENLYDTINDPGVSDGEYVDYNYTLKIKELSSSITLFSPDILGVCEVENYGVLEDLNVALDSQYNIVHYDSRDIRGIDLGLFFSKEHFELNASELIESEYLWRGILSAEFSIVGSEEKIRFLVAHLPSQRGGRKAKMLRERALLSIDSIAQNSSCPTVVLGDMNENPREMRYLHNCAVKAFKSSVVSYIYRDVWSLFDQVMVAPELKVRLRGGQRVVCNNSLITQRGRFSGYPRRGRPSDHLPVFIDLEF